ncbi:hypothetical protein CPC16_008701 [Podila verticillata]|nr:hypothetical protein CPC16_008701 [Podila verticillata]
MSVPVSIFDITLIVDSICHDLSLHDIQACRQVNKQWSILFKPHLWSTTILLSHPALPNDPKLAAFFANKHWIRSLTLTPHQAVVVSDSGLFTTLRELALFEDHTHGYDRRVYKRNHVVALINSNSQLESLRIDLCCNYYNNHECGLSQAIMLVIANHPSLTRITWHIPERYKATEFALCLLYACHMGAIQELIVECRHYSEPRHDIGFEYCGCWWYCCCCSFSHDEFARLGLDSEATYRLLRDKLEVPMDELEEPFAFRRLCLPSLPNPVLLELLPNCPDLQHIEVSMPCQDEEKCAELLKVLASNYPRLRGLVLWDTLRNVDYAHTIGRFQGLQRLEIPSMSERDKVNRIVEVLASSSSRTSLESLGISMHALSAEDIVSILATFPNLKELDVEDIKISVRSTLGVYKPLQDKDIDSIETVARGWDPALLHLQQFRQQQWGDMSEWWRWWSRALRFMKAIRDEYHSYQQELTETMRTSCEEQRRSISMRFMYPIRAFMNRAQLHEYLQATGPKAKHARGFTLMDAYRLARGEVESKEAYAVYESWYYRRWNEYDARFEYDWGGIMEETAQEYTIAKSRNRHRSLRDRKRSSFRRPFKK